MWGCHVDPEGIVWDSEAESCDLLFGTRGLGAWLCSHWWLICSVRTQNYSLSFFPEPAFSSVSSSAPLSCCPTGAEFQRQIEGEAKQPTSWHDGSLRFIPENYILKDRGLILKDRVIKSASSFPLLHIHMKKWYRYLKHKQKQSQKTTFWGDVIRSFLRNVVTFWQTKVMMLSNRIWLFGPEVVTLRPGFLIRDWQYDD